MSENATTLVVKVLKMVEDAAVKNQQMIRSALDECTRQLLTGARTQGRSLRLTEMKTE